MVNLRRWSVVAVGVAWGMSFGGPGRTPRTGRVRQAATATAVPASSAVVAVQSDADFLAAMEASNEALVVVKYYASWCRACKTIEPRFKRLAVEFHDVAGFYEVEFSANKDLCRRLGIKKLPCVQFYRGAEGCLDTVMAGPSKFADVRAKCETLLGIHPDPDIEVPEFTDVSAHYDDPLLPEATTKTANGLTANGQTLNGQTLNGQTLL
ncbi:hypothetical protein CTAYLR_004655 [Chrysophaeum taylorii]|uniref:Thioredoxin domain-containing protein n=1 Tax=Chrysophaeum taylorii TaxID=2483200 RepID=A0AAD7U788_9STRA|nr:hypothetical protein CTAYLR_004655 [Chrysophaeum taylorii]